MTRLVRAALLPLLLAAASPALAAEPVRATPDPVAKLWSDFIAKGDLDQAYAAYDPVFELEMSGEIDRATCEKHMDALAAATRKVPVGAALWYQAYRCAQALGRNEEAEAFNRGFAALARHAFAQASEDSNAEPIRVLQMTDIQALVAATGMEFLYEYVDLSAAGRYLPHRVVVFDKERSRERHFSFDMVDTAAKMNREPRAVEFPVSRISLMRSLIEGIAESKSELGLDLAAMRDAAQQDDADKALAGLHRRGESGGVGSSLTVLQRCLQEPVALCDDIVADVLLPYAEQGYGVHTVLLAVAYSRGLGVAKDEKAALTLLDAAAKRLGEGRALALYVGTQMTAAKPGALPSAVLRRLEAAVAGGDELATIILAAWQQKSGVTLAPAMLERLSAVADKGFPSAYGLVAHGHMQASDTEAARAWLLRAGATRLGTLQLMLARMYEQGEVFDKDREQARHWYAEAGMSAESRAMNWMASYYEEKQDWPRMVGWLQSAASVGDLPATLELARAYLAGHQGVQGSKDDALEILRELDRDFDYAPARSYLASLHLEGDILPKDAAITRGLLEPDARKGDAMAQYLLGSAIKEGLLEPASATEGIDWLEKAVAQEFAPALIDFGMALYYGRGIARDLDRAIILLERVAKKGVVLALNNLAWAFCTAPDAKLRDPARGLGYTEKMGDPDKLDPGYIDTVAACHAASGDFTKAVELQRKAVSGLPDDASDDLRRRLSQRIDDYRAGKPYIETEIPEPSDE